MARGGGENRTPNSTICEVHSCQYRAGWINGFSELWRGPRGKKQPQILPLRVAKHQDDIGVDGVRVLARRQPRLDYTDAAAVCSSLCRPAYLPMPTMVKTFWKWGVRPKAATFCPDLSASIRIWMMRAMPLELM
jgi:hypothetical protein